MPRKVLARMLILLATTGGVLFAIPFALSLGPSATAGKSLPHLNVKLMKPGEYQYFDSGSEDRWYSTVYLVIRDTSGRFKVFEMYKQGERILLPGVHPWAWSGVCKTFSLMPPKGNLMAKGNIRCLDEQQGEYVTREARWSYSGKNLGTHFTDLLSRQFTLESDEIIVGKSNSPWFFKTNSSTPESP